MVLRGVDESQIVRLHGWCGKVLGWNPSGWGHDGMNRLDCGMRSWEERDSYNGGLTVEKRGGFRAYMLSGRWAPDAQVHVRAVVLMERHSAEWLFAVGIGMRRDAI